MQKIISKTKLKSQLKRKTSSETITTIREAKKHNSWLPLAKFLSGPTRKYVSLNLSEIDEKSTAGDTVLIPGKVLSQGSLTKKIRICSLGISSGAREKLKKTKSEAISILQEIKINPKAEGIKILR